MLFLPFSPPFLVVLHRKPCSGEDFHLLGPSVQSMYLHLGQLPAGSELHPVVLVKKNKVMHKHIPTYGQIRAANPLSGMFLGGGMKPEDLEETHIKKHVQHQKTFAKQGSWSCEAPTHYATILPIDAF